MKFKSLLLILLFISNVFASNVDIKNLTPEQLETLKEIKKHGQDTGLSYTLMAIAIKESKLGEYMVNLDTKDFGLATGHSDLRSHVSVYRTGDAGFLHPSRICTG